MEVSDQQHIPSALVLERNPGTHWIGSWVGTELVGMFGEQKGLLPLWGFKPWIVHSIAYSLYFFNCMHGANVWKSDKTAWKVQLKRTSLLLNSPPSIYSRQIVIVCVCVCVFQKIAGLKFCKTILWYIYSKPYFITTCNIWNSMSHSTNNYRTEMQ